MKRSELFLSVLQLPVDYLMLLFAAASAYSLRLSDWAVGLKPITFDLTFSHFFEVSGLVSILWIVVFAVSGLYSINPNRKFAREILTVFLSCTVGLSLLALYIVFSQKLFDSRFLIFFGWGFAIVYVLIGRLFIRGLKGFLYRNGVGLRKVVIIGNDKMTDQLINTLETRKELGYSVLKNYKQFDDKTIRALGKMSFDEMIYTNATDNQKESILAIDFCHEAHIVFKYSADLFSSYASHSSVHPLAGIPIVELKRTNLEGWGRVIKRLFDIIFGLILFIITLPMVLVISLITFIETSGPIIYKNERVGYRGKIFIAYKFRSMYKEYCTGPQFGNSGKKALKEEEKLIKTQNTRQGPIYKVGKDPRITPFGRILRRFSLDEFPQFWNVVVGNMSLVGPRPHQPREVSGYIKEHKKVFSVKPGITGLAQISGRSDLPYDEEVRLDVFYIENWNIFLDVIIILKTPFILLKRRKAL